MYPEKHSASNFLRYISIPASRPSANSPCPQARRVPHRLNSRNWRFISAFHFIAASSSPTRGRLSAPYDPELPISNLKSQIPDLKPQISNPKPPGPVPHRPVPVLDRRSAGARQAECRWQPMVSCATARRGPRFAGPISPRPPRLQILNKPPLLGKDPLDAPEQTGILVRLGAFAGDSEGLCGRTGA